MTQPSTEGMLLQSPSADLKGRPPQPHNELVRADRPTPAVHSITIKSNPQLTDVEGVANRLFEGLFFLHVLAEEFFIWLL